MSNERLNRNEMFFGTEGQDRIRGTTCAVVGVGGLGTQVVQQLSLLGVGGLNLIDSEETDTTNRNRYVGLRHDDPVPGFRKVDLGERLVHSIDPTISVRKVFDSFISEAGFSAIRSADWVFGCLDCEGARLILTELCSAYGRAYIDVASDINPKTAPPAYGGRVCVSLGGQGCLVCLNVLDTDEAARDLEGEAERRNREAIYGVPRAALGRSGPSVVSINGMMASIAVTEFMVAVTGLRQPKAISTYYGHSGKVTVSVDAPRKNCWYCSLWEQGAKVDVERYIRDGIGKAIR